MRRLLGRLADFYGKHAVTIDLALIVAGANAVKRRFLDLGERLEAIEKGGMVPRDDLVTLRDLDNKVGPVLVAHQRALIDAGLLEDSRPPIDVEVVDESPEASSETQEAPAEAPGAP